MKNLKIPPVFFDWVNYLCTALNVRSIPTFIELLIGSMLTQTGFVTDAQMAIDTNRHWGSYYKWIQQGSWSYLALAKKLLVLIIETFGLKELFIIFDDTYVPRSSKKAPDAKYHHQHGSKANRPKYIFGQCLLVDPGSRLGKRLCRTYRFKAYFNHQQYWQAQGCQCHPASDDIDTLRNQNHTSGR